MPMPHAARAVRVLAAPQGEPAAAARRLLALRDAAEERHHCRRAVEALAAAIQQALSGLRAEVDARLEQVATSAVELGLAVAREVVGDAIMHGAFDAAGAVRRCLQHAVVGERAAITIFVAPSDLERVRGELADALPPGASLAADPDLAPASVRVETDAGTVAYDTGEVLRRLCDELRKELAACR
ncbi:MAG TPA: FliH/SctL family protein [Planctomycetota bacterium]|nr:FliH/SctL family protein [Planctomycetota bacterium]